MFALPCSAVLVASSLLARLRLRFAWFVLQSAGLTDGQSLPAGSNYFAKNKQTRGHYFNSSLLRHDRQPDLGHWIHMEHNEPAEQRNGSLVGPKFRTLTCMAQAATTIMLLTTLFGTTAGQVSYS